MNTTSKVPGMSGLTPKPRPRKVGDSKVTIPIKKTSALGPSELMLRGFEESEKIAARVESAKHLARTTPGVWKRIRGNRRRRGSMLCRIGIHHWSAWDIQPGAFRDVEKHCRRCGRSVRARWARPHSEATTTRGGSRKSHTRAVSRSDPGPRSPNPAKGPPTAIGRVIWMVIAATGVLLISAALVGPGASAGEHTVIGVTAVTDFMVTVDGVELPGSPVRSDAIGILMFSVPGAGPGSVFFGPIGSGAPGLVCKESPR